MISHDRAQSLISARYDELLSPVDTRELQEHLATCAACRQFATETDLLVNGLRTLPQLPPSPQVSRMVRAGIRDGAAPRGWLSKWLRVASSPGLAVASSLVLVAALAFIIVIALQPLGLEEQPRATISALADVIETPTNEPERTPIAAPTVAPTELAVIAPTQEPTQAPTQEPAPEPTVQRTNVVPPTQTPVPAETRAAVEPTVAPTERPILAQAQSTVPPAVETVAPTEIPPTAEAPAIEPPPQAEPQTEPEPNVVEIANEAAAPDPTSAPILPASDGAPITSQEELTVADETEAPPTLEQPIIEQGGPPAGQVDVPGTEGSFDEGAGDVLVASMPEGEPEPAAASEPGPEVVAEPAPDAEATAQAAAEADAEAEQVVEPAAPTSTPVQIVAAETPLPPPSGEVPVLQPRSGNEAVSMSGDSMVAEIQATVQAGLNDNSGPPTFPPEPTALPTTPPQAGQDDLTPSSENPGVIQPVGAEITGAPVTDERSMSPVDEPPVEGDPNPEFAPQGDDPAASDPAAGTEFETTAIDPAAGDPAEAALVESAPIETEFETEPEDIPVVPQVVGVPEPAWPGIGGGGTQFMSNAGYSAISDGGGVSVYGPDGTPIGFIGGGVPVWSPGGTSVLVVGPDGLGAVWDANVGLVPVERPDASARDIPVGWYDGSPLVHRLYFDGSGRSELRVAPVTGAGGYVLGSATSDSVFGDGVSSARLSPDGGQISFVSGGTLYIAPVSDPGSAAPAW